jgi:DNA replication protein DnaC
MIQQRLVFGECNVTIYSICTSYRIQKSLNQFNKKLDSPPLLIMDDIGIIQLNEKTKKFQVDNMIYTRLRKNSIVNVCPYVPFNLEEEKSCYSTLLIHTAWPMEGEKCLLLDCDSSIQRLKQLISEGGLPTYVQPMLIREQISQEFRNNRNHRNSNNEVNGEFEPLLNGYNDGNDDNENSNDNNNENIELIESDLNTEIFIERQLHPGIEVITNISQSSKQYFVNYIRNRQIEYMLHFAEENQISGHQQIYLNRSIEVVPLNNSSERIKKLNEKIALLTIEQMDAYNKIVNYLSGDNGEQMIMFISGEGGTGKSYLLEVIVEYERLTYGKQVGIYGPALIITPTGAAASVVGGFTWQSIYGKGISTKKKSKNESLMSPITAKAVGTKLNGLKFIVIDEISMISLQTLYEISERQKEAMISITQSDEEIRYIRSKPFGGLHVLFTGDLYQLKPIGGTPIYLENPIDELAISGKNEIWHKLKEYKELTINTRFKNDETPHLRNFLKGARIGKIDDNLLQIMNSRIMTSVFAAKTSAGPNATWIAHTRQEVKKINDSDFRDKINEGTVNYRIVTQHKPVSELIMSPSFDERKKLFSIYPKKGVPPFIDLAIGTRVSCTRNLGTQIGKTIMTI